MLGALSIGAQTLTLTAGANVSSGIAGVTFGAATLSASGATFAPAAGTVLTLPSVAGGAFSFTVNGAGDAAITGAVATTSGGITKSGAGTLTLAGNSSFTGATTINAGVVKLGGAGSGANSPLGTIGTGTSVLATGAALDLNGFSLVTAEPLSLIGTGVGGTGALTNSSGTAATFLGAVTIGAGGASIGGTGDLMFNAALAGSDLLTKTGANTLKLTASSVRTGDTQIDAGTIKLANATGLSAVAQTVTLNGGTLDLATDTSVSAYPMRVIANSTLTSDKATAASAGITHTLGSLALNASTLTVNSGANLSANSAFGVTFGATTLSGHATVSVANNGSGAGTVLLGAIGDGGGGYSLTKEGAGELVFNGVNTHTGGVTLSSGTLIVNPGATLAATTAPLVVNGGTLALNNSVTVGSLSSVGSGGMINFASGKVLTLNQIGPSTYAGALGGLGGLTKSGAGSATLSGSSDYHGPTVVNGGTLALGSNSALSAYSALTLDAGTLALAGFGATGSTLMVGGTGGNGTIDFGAAIASTLALADSHSVAWAQNATLTITNYTIASGDLLRFGSSASALSPTQLSAISFAGYAGGATIDSLGYVSPSAIPEPAGVTALLGAAALLIAVRRRRSA